MTGSGRRGKEGGAEGCGVERRDAMVVEGGSESRERGDRIG